MVIVLLGVGNDMLRPALSMSMGTIRYGEVVTQQEFQSIKNVQLTELAKQALQDLGWLLECQKDIPLDLACGENISMEEVKEQAELVRSYLDNMLVILNP